MTLSNLPIGTRSEREHGGSHQEGERFLPLDFGPVSLEADTLGHFPQYRGFLFR